MKKSKNTKPNAVEVAAIIADMKAKGISAANTAKIASTSRTRKQIADALKAEVRAK